MKVLNSKNLDRLEAKNPVKQAAATARWKSPNEAKACLMGTGHSTVPPWSCRGCGSGCGEKRIHDLEHDPRLSTPSMTNATAQELAAARPYWVAAGCEGLELEIGSPRERFTAGKPIVFQRWALGPG